MLTRWHAFPQVVKLVRANKQLLAVKQLAAQQCVVESCNEADGCDNSRFVDCVKGHILKAQKVRLH